MQSARRVKRTRISVVMLLVATLADLEACGGGGGAGGSTYADLPLAVMQAREADSAVDPRIVTADNTFGLDLFNVLDQGQSGNVAISPLSISLVLQILYNGANGSTQQAMSQALRLQGLTARDVNSANAALQASLIGADSQVQLTIANSLWMHLSSNPVLPSFIDTNKTYYGAEIGDLSGAPDNVNAWVSSKTNGLITLILPPDDYRQVVAVIANALYFKGTWTTQFDPRDTASAAFTLNDGTQTSCQMMHQSGNYPYLKGAGFQAVRLPYGQKRMSMIIVLPDYGVSLYTLMSGMTLDNLNAWVSELQSSPGTIALPRFSAEYRAALIPALQAIGMGDALDWRANFSGIAPGIYLSKVEHKAVVRVDETGTVAAAATAAAVTTSVGFMMTMDHPFFYAIRDDKTGLLIFIGTLVKPAS